MTFPRYFLWSALCPLLLGILVSGETSTFGASFSALHKFEKQLASEIKVLDFYADMKPVLRKPKKIQSNDDMNEDRHHGGSYVGERDWSTPESQLICLGGSQKYNSKIHPTYVRCNKIQHNIDEDSMAFRGLGSWISPKMSEKKWLWNCAAPGLEKNYVMNDVDIVCQGYANDNDDKYILRGSCVLYYTLDRQDSGQHPNEEQIDEQRHDRRRGENTVKNPLERNKVSFTSDFWYVIGWMSPVLMILLFNYTCKVLELTPRARQDSHSESSRRNEGVQTAHNEVTNNNHLWDNSSLGVAFWKVYSYGKDGVLGLYNSLTTATNWYAIYSSIRTCVEKAYRALRTSLNWQILQTNITAYQSLSSYLSICYQSLCSYINNSNISEIASKFAQHVRNLTDSTFLFVRSTLIPFILNHKPHIIAMLSVIAAYFSRGSRYRDEYNSYNARNMGNYRNRMPYTRGRPSHPYTSDQSYGNQAYGLGSVFRYISGNNRRRY